MTTMFLNDDELNELTGKKRYGAQIRVLNAIGVQHKIRPDGSIAVLRAHVERVFGERPQKDKQPPEPEPDWSAAL